MKALHFPITQLLVRESYVLGAIIVTIMFILTGHVQEAFYLFMVLGSYLFVRQVRNGKPGTPGSPLPTPCKA
jgi:uncharacterized membrane protein YoaK (UPF0700 family)